ncbi:MAG: multidrug transporter [Nitrospirae bacterium]|nr:multidrug transporter [Nitrospirota bacterium]
MKGKTIKSISVIVVFTGIGALLIWAFMEGYKERLMEQERERPVKSPSRVSIREGESAVTLDMADQRRSGIAVEVLKPISHQEEVRAYGTVVELHGLIEQRKNLIDLRKNIIDLRNSYAVSRTQVEKAQAILYASSKEYERLKALNSSNKNISDRVLEAAEASWRSDEANLRAANEALHAAQEVLHSLEDSLHVVEDSVRQQWGEVIAQWLFGATRVFERLIKQQDIMIQVTLPSGISISSAPPIIRIQGVNGRQVSANLVSPSPRTDPRIQGLSFFYIAPAKESGLLPGMNVIAHLPLGKQVKGIIIPDKGVVWWQGRAWVYIQEGTESFIRREVSTEIPVIDGWFAARGLLPGDRIVIKGAQLLLSEEFRSQIQVGEGGER